MQHLLFWFWCVDVHSSNSGACKTIISMLYKFLSSFCGYLSTWTVLCENFQTLVVCVAFVFNITKIRWMVTGYLNMMSGNKLVYRFVCLMVYMKPYNDWIFGDDLISSMKVLRHAVDGTLFNYTRIGFEGNDTLQGVSTGSHSRKP